jgi:hypothetical protein
VTDLVQSFAIKSINQETTCELAALRLAGWLLQVFDELAWKRDCHPRTVKSDNPAPPNGPDRTGTILKDRQKTTP